MRRLVGMSTRNGRLASKAFLLKEMVLRDLKSRYAGSGLGIAWVFVHPILWMVLYTAVFSLVLRVPVEPGYASFPEFLMAGLLPWMAISEGIARSSSVLVDNASMVKKTVFPLETLVLSIVVSAAVTQLVAVIGHLRLAWLLWVVPALALQVLLTFGLGCLVATLTAFVRDAMHAVGIVLTVAFYASPIVYPASLVPPRLRPWIAANPITHLVDLYRRAFTLHAAPDPAGLAYLLVFSLLAAAAGATIFARARPHFADLI
jgi:lipopolysaccharide transport system permease protein